MIMAIQQMHRNDCTGLVNEISRRPYANQTPYAPITIKYFNQEQHGNAYFSKAPSTSSLHQLGKSTTFFPVLASSAAKTMA